MKYDKKRNMGFTLVELMVALFLVSIATIGMYRTYVNTVAVFNAQEQQIEITQNLRLGLGIISKDLRMAGYDPAGSSNAGFVAASTNFVSMSMDLNGNGLTSDAGEIVTYALNSGALERNSSPFINNVDAVEFLYFDRNNAATTTKAEIRKVQVSLVARSTNPDPSYTDSEAYKNLQGTTIYTAASDNYRRRILSEQVRCRNMGL